MSGVNKSHRNFDYRGNSEAALLKHQARGTELFMDGIKNIYWAEQQLYKSLPAEMISASTGELANAIQRHHTITGTHIARLEKIFELMREPAIAKKCDLFESLCKDNRQIIDVMDTGTAKYDKGLTIAAQRVEHFEITSYKRLTLLASALGLTEVTFLLTCTLNEEEKAGLELCGIFETDVDYDLSSE